MDGGGRMNGRTDKTDGLVDYPPRTIKIFKCEQRWTVGQMNESPSVDACADYEVLVLRTKNFL